MLNLIDLRTVHFGYSSNVSFKFCTMKDALLGATAVAKQVKSFRIRGNEEDGFTVDALPIGVDRYYDDSWYTLSELTEEDVAKLEELAKKEDYEAQYGDLQEE
jgi:hypothetical protein